MMFSVRFDLDEIDLAARHVEKDLAREVTKEVAELAVGIWEDVKRLSPVDTGRYRASHQINEGAPSPDVHPGLSKAQLKNRLRGDAEIPEPLDPGINFNQVQDFPVIFVTNALPYANDLEDGTSTQAPDGVYQVVSSARGI